MHAFIPLSFPAVKGRWGAEGSVFLLSLLLLSSIISLFSSIKSSWIAVPSGKAHPVWKDPVPGLQWSISCGTWSTSFFSSSSSDLHIHTDVSYWFHPFSLGQWHSLPLIWYIFSVTTTLAARPSYALSWVFWKQLQLIMLSTGQPWCLLPMDTVHPPEQHLGSCSLYKDLLICSPHNLFNMQAHCID